MARLAIWLRRIGWVALGASLATAVSSMAAQSTRPDTIYRKLEILAEVLGHVENHFVDAVSPRDLVYGAAQGAVSRLDEHSAFFSPEEYTRLLDATEGEYAGIGVELVWDDDAPKIVNVLDGSPAQKAGLQTGDKILAVNNEPVNDGNLEMLQQRLRGPVGTKVVVALLRHGHEAQKEFTLIRGWVRMRPLDHQVLEAQVQYVRVKAFSRRVTGDLDALLARQEHTRGLILDLRGNPGGLFDEAVAMCDLFLDSGPIVMAVGRGGRVIERHTAHSRGTFSNFPMAVLIDRGSASAAEVVAGALRDRGRARLFGERSYGKGSVQSILDLTDGSGLKLTVARYLTPSGRVIDGAGIAPDEAVEAPGGVPALERAVSWLQEQGSTARKH